MQITDTCMIFVMKIPFLGLLYMVAIHKPCYGHKGNPTVIKLSVSLSVTSFGQPNIFVQMIVQPQMNVHTP